MPLLALGHACRPGEKKIRPNILLLMSDNQSWNHLGCYGDRVVRTPDIDRIAEQGVKFSHAFCAAPSCSPARAGMLTGQDIWRLEEGANLWGILPDKFPFYTDLLEDSGYYVGSQGKGWGPGSVADSGREYNHGGRSFPSFGEFLQGNSENRPWCYWFSSQNPHRPYEVGSGESSGMDPAEVEVPAYLPDNVAVRGDICDYYYEIQKFDTEVGEILELLDASGQRESTLIVICSDNGWQMPRGLANLYDFGTRVPLIFSWPGQIPGGRSVEDFVNLNDLAPTFLEIAGLPVPGQMTARSLTGLLFSSRSGRVDPSRDRVFTARERHAMCRMNGLGYPGRAIRTRDFLFIRNYEPERWPGGDPPLYGDCDSHMLHYPAPTKLYLLSHKDDPEVAPLFELAFGKRPAEELFDLRSDPEQMHNVAFSEDYAAQKAELSAALDDYLTASGDPRATGRELIWEKGRYYEVADFKPRPSREAIEALGLEEEYNYFPE
ncbi:MAG: sulfatase [Candidatus Glassbacteria bacterium]|nr:sulfatase [Candidatus Glassbacteria bacterium]